MTGEVRRYRSLVGFEYADVVTVLLRRAPFRRLIPARGAIRQFFQERKVVARFVFLTCPCACIFRMQIIVPCNILRSHLDPFFIKRRARAGVHLFHALRGIVSAAIAGIRSPVPQAGDIEAAELRRLDQVIPDQVVVIIVAAGRWVNMCVLRASIHRIRLRIAQPGDLEIRMGFPPLAADVTHLMAVGTVNILVSIDVSGSRNAIAQAERAAAAPTAAPAVADNPFVFAAIATLVLVSRDQRQMLAGLLVHIGVNRLEVV